MLKRLGVWLWFVSAFLIVCMALALSSARLLLPAMADYKADLEALASRQLQHEVTIGSLSASWRGMSPALSLRHLHVDDERFEDGALKVEEVQIALDIWRSLVERRWRTRLLDVSGLSVRIFRHLDSSWSFFETPQQEDGTEWLEQLLLQKRIGFRELQVTLVDQVRGGLTRKFRDAEFTLTNDGDRHRFSLSFRLPAALGRELSFVGDFVGAGVDLPSWSGRLYLNAERVDAQQWAEYMPGLMPALSGIADAQLWVDWHGGMATRVVGGAALEKPALALQPGGEAVFRAQQITGRFLWSRGEDGWRIEVSDLALAHADDAHSVSDIALSADWRATGRQFRLAANRLPLRETGRLARLAPGVTLEVRNWLDRLEPDGLVTNLELDARLEDSQAPRVALQMDFSQVGTAAFERVPAFSGLSGRIQGNLQSGEVRVDSNDAVFSAPALFRESLMLTRLYGGIHWTRYADRLRVQGDNLLVDTPDAQSRSSIQADWIDGASLPWLEIATELGRVELAAVPAYLPVGIMPPKTVAWLERALVSGQADGARFIFQGKPEGFPFRRGEGVLLAGFDFDDAMLDYHPQWGRLYNLQGQARFRDASMQVTGDKARILDVDVRRAVVSIDDFHKPQLIVRGTVDGQLPAMTNYVATTPLAPRFKRFLDVVRSSGPAGLELDLSVPLSPRTRHKTRVKGELSLRNDRLAEKDGLFELTAIQGNVFFSESTLRANDVKARLDGAPAIVNVRKEKTTGDIEIVVDGSPDLVGRVRDLGWPIGPELDGRADSRVRVRIAEKHAADEPPLQVEVASDLQGIGSLLAEPFGKLPEDARDFKLQWSPGHMDRWPLRLRYGSQVDAVVLLDANGGVKSGALQVGGGQAQLPDDSRFRIAGQTQRVRPLPWARLFTGDAPDGRRGRFPPLQFDLALERLSLFNYELADVQISTDADDPWRFRIAGTEDEGEVNLVFGPAGKLEAVEAALQRLHVKVPDKKTWAAQKNRVRDITPGLMPRFDFDVGALTWGDRHLGHFVLETARAERGVDIRRMQVNSDALVADATGQWYEVQGNQSTRLSIDVRGGTLERLLQWFGDSKSVAGAPLDGSMHATWAGSPADFSLEGLHGELHVKLGEGRLVDVEPGAGKLLGLLSLQSLPRRLLLDFSDLFKKGFSFDRIKGDFQLTETNAYTDNLHIAGPAADIYIKGRTGLAQQDYDEVITVVPNITATLPIAGAIAGGPAVGAAVLLAERLLGDQVNKMSKVEYHVTGAWADPKYERVVKKSARSGTDE
jgi:uncharacterized protein (TIGR02099 family)